MIIAQITDLHYGGGSGCFKDSNVERLRSIRSAIAELRIAPDMLVITGDLTEDGTTEQYLKLKDELAALKTPIFLALGNHDNRSAFSEVFPHYALQDGFVQYTIDDQPVRIIVLDTLEEGRHGGAFCESRGEWLETELAKQPNQPTLIALHHPPIASGIDWLTADPNADWVRRLNRIISKYDNIVHMISGHIHRTIHTKFAGTTLSVLDAIAPQVALELGTIDENKPDNRILLVEGRPAFALHVWDGQALTTHVQHIPRGDTIARYDDNHAYVVKMTQDQHA